MVNLYEVNKEKAPMTILEFREVKDVDVSSMRSLVNQEMGNR